jgi:hypothetical protein
MKSFKTIKFWTLSLMLAMPLAWANEVNWRPYNDSVISSKAQGQYTLLGFHKKGCSTCSVQDSSLAPILNEKEFSHIVPVKVQIEDKKFKPVVDKYKIVTQSTLVLLRDGKEIGRTAPGITDSQEIRKFLEKTL